MKNETLLRAIRAVACGLAGAALICGYTYFNDHVIRQTYFIGNNMPLSVYGGLILFLILLNPVLRFMRHKLAFSGWELALVLAMTLAACVVPGSGLLRTFTASLMLPHKFEKTEPGWKEEGALELAPEVMLAQSEGEGQPQDAALNGFLAGSKDGIPWSAWSDTLSFWVPLILLLWIGLLGLALVVHRQWAEHEQLPYPIAKFADALLPTDGKRSSVFANRLFWIALIIVLLIHGNNYLYAWFPRTLVEIPRTFDFTALRTVTQTILRGGGWFAYWPTLYFTVIAFSYFLASDVSASLGIGPYLFAYVSGFLAINYGISMGGGSHFSARPTTFLNFGAYLGLFVVLLYTGRHHYLHTVKQALFLPDDQDVASSSVWGARVTLLTGAGFILMLASVGFDWQLGLMVWFGIMMIFLVMGRILAETGLFFIQPTTFATVILVGIFGAQALGPEIIVIAFLLSSILMIDPREAFMPFIVNDLKLLDMRQIKLGKGATACAVALMVGLAVGIPATLYFQYSKGADMRDGWATQYVPRFPFDSAVPVKQKLEAQGVLDDSLTMGGFERFAAMSPDWNSLGVLLIGFGLVVAFSFGRLRFTWWPLHPVLFLVWTSFPGKQFAFSFLIGWLIKVFVTKYGGAKVYQDLKPLMFGLIAGDMLGGIVPSLIGLIYYLITGNTPESFRIMPG